MKKIKKILIIELALLMAASCVVFAMKAPAKQTPEPQKTPASTAEKPATEKKISFRQTNELVWTTDLADYYTDYGETYEATFSKEVSLQRTGISEEWSRIKFDDKTYYVETKYLTKKSPFEVDEGDKGRYQEYALSQFAKYDWDPSELQPLITLWDKESGWNPRAENSSSGAYGIPQSLPAYKMKTEGDDYLTNAETQINWGLKYIKGRYGTPTKALEFHLNHNWY